MKYLGDFLLGQNVDFKFTTVNASGVPTTLAGSPVLEWYVGNSAVQSGAGITLSVDFDLKTGTNHVRVVATSGNGFAAGTDVQLVITTGTVGGNSVVGYEVASFSIENRTPTAAQIRAALGLASANLDTQLGTIDDFLDTEVGAIKAKTDQLIFTVGGKLDVNTLYINGTQLQGDGSVANPWRKV